MSICYAYSLSIFTLPYFYNFLSVSRFFLSLFHTHTLISFTHIHALPPSPYMLWNLGLHKETQKENRKPGKCRNNKKRPGVGLRKITIQFVAISRNEDTQFRFSDFGRSGRRRPHPDPCLQGQVGEDNPAWGGHDHPADQVSMFVF